MVILYCINYYVLYIVANCDRLYYYRYIHAYTNIHNYINLCSISLPFSLFQPALDYITYIGCSISLLCLLACIIFYLTLR